MRLITRADFDGLACSILLDRLGLIDFWEFVHPTEVQQGRVKVTGNDVIANLPYVPGCRMWFDHHTSETERLGQEFFEEYEAVMGRREEAAAVPTLGVVEHSGGFIKEYETVKVSYAAPSCARVVYDFYTRHGYRFDQFVEMVRCVDKVDSANLTGEELADPRGWILLGLVMDPRTGLEKFKKYSVGLKELTVRLSAACQDHGIEEILDLPELKERVDAYFEQQPRYREAVRRYCRTEGNVIVLDLRGVKSIPIGSRFLLYAMYPEQNISLTVMDGTRSGAAALALGYSIINKTAQVDVGSLLLRYGGGGHRQVGSCTVNAKDADRVMAEIVLACNGGHNG